MAILALILTLFITVTTLLLTRLNAPSMQSFCRREAYKTLRRQPRTEIRHNTYELGELYDLSTNASFSLDVHRALTANAGSTVINTSTRGSCVETDLDIWRTSKLLPSRNYSLPLNSLLANLSDDGHRLLCNESNFLSRGPLSTSQLQKGDKEQSEVDREAQIIDWLLEWPILIPGFAKVLAFAWFVDMYSDGLRCKEVPFELVMISPIAVIVSLQSIACLTLGHMLILTEMSVFHWAEDLCTRSEQGVMRMNRWLLQLRGWEIIIIILRCSRYIERLDKIWIYLYLPSLVIPLFVRPYTYPQVVYFIALGLFEWLIFLVIFIKDMVDLIGTVVFLWQPNWKELEEGRVELFGCSAYQENSTAAGS